MGETSPDVVVVGAGIIGCSIAYYLAALGVRAEVLERGCIGKEASWAGAGILGAQSETESAGPFLELSLRSRRLYPELVSQLREETGIDVGYNAAGILYAMQGEAEQEQLNRRAKWQQSIGLRVEVLSASEARRREPALDANVAGALFFPDDGQVHNPHLVEALVRAARQRQIRFRENEEVFDIQALQDGVEVRTRSERRTASHVVIASGAWSSHIGGIDAAYLRVEPIRGQIAVVEPPAGSVRHVIYCHHGYLVPRPSGKVLIGSTTERAGFDKSVTAEALDRLRNMASRLIPALADLPLVGSWAGLRPATPDKLPYLGPLPGQPRIIAATGHFRNGILLAPITGQLIAGGIATGKFDPLIGNFAPRRVVLGANPSWGN